MGVMFGNFDCIRTAVYQHNHLFHPEKIKQQSKKAVCVQWILAYSKLTVSALTVYSVIQWYLQKYQNVN